MPNGEHEPHADTRDLMQMLTRAIEGLGKVMDYDPLAPQALIAAETLMTVTEIPLAPVSEQDLADRWG